jgi:predicted CXXCH cytochrome family protein
LIKAFRTEEAACALLAIAMLAPAAQAQVSLCAPCHAEIAASFQQTGMGRSFSAVSSSVRSSVSAETFPEKPYYHEASDSYFAMIERGGRVFQRRWQLGFDGNPTNVEEKQVDFVLGSGNHAKTYLHLTARGTLQQLPLGWYAEKAGYFAMNPGYDRPDYPGSTRAISYECMFCHNAYPKIPASNREEGAEAKYLAPVPEGIDCQRCHGPGQDHAATSGKAAIVNPARLAPERELEICLQCHLETTSRLLPHSIQKHGRAPFSYVAGQPLGEFELTFDRAAGKNQSIEVAGGAYRFRQSQCFLKSEGKLRCTTCHNPHDIPRGEAATSQYNKVCVDCHGAAHRAGENCVGCHMPATRTDDAVHIAITDHRIQRARAAGDPMAAKAETPETPATSYRGPVAPYYPAKVDALYEAVAQVRDGSNLQAGLPRLASLVAQKRPAGAGFYVDLGEGYRAGGDSARAIRWLEEALARSPESLVIPLKLGNALIEARQWAKAEATLRRATVRAPADPLAWGLLGWALWQQDKRAEGKATLEKAIQLDPEVPELHNYLGSLLMGIGDRAGAERAFRDGVRIEPGIAEWRANLARLLASLGQIPEARYHFEQTVRFKAEYAAGRFEYARLLSALGETAEAEKHAKAAVGAEPALEGAHELWGALMANRGELDGALRELEAAVRIAPGFAKAQYELGLALYSKGDSDAAIEHLRLAAKSGYVEAEQFLKKIEK